jgi:hypothetical protein
MRFYLPVLLSFASLILPVHAEAQTETPKPVPPASDDSNKHHSSGVHQHRGAKAGGDIGLVP